MTKNKPKILYIVTQGHWGGAQKYIFDLAKNTTNNFEITIAVGEPNTFPDLQKKLLKNNSAKLIQLNFLQRVISPLKDLIAIMELINIYKKVKPDIIHLNSTKAGVIGSLALKFSGLKNTKLLYTSHGWVFNEPMNALKKYIYIMAEKFTAKLKNKIIVLSEKEKQIAIKILRIPAEKLEIIPVGIDIEAEKTPKNIARQNLAKIINKTENESQNNYIVGAIANFYYTKNLDNLIRAAAIARKEIKNIKIIIIGDGPERKKLEDLITELNLQDTIYLTGFLENARQYLPAFDLFVLPSRKEGLPYTVLEAKANKIPIIATNVGSISDLIENKKTGLLIKSENETELSEALIYAFSHQDEMKQMSEIAPGNINDYAKTNTVQKIIFLYQKLLP